ALARGNAAEARALLEGLQPFGQGRTASGALWELQARGELELDAGRAHQALAWFDRARALGRAVGSPEAVWRAETGRGRAYLALALTGPAIAALGAAETRLEETLVVLPAGEGRDEYVATHESGTRKLVEALVATGRTGDALATARRARARVLRLAVQ